MRGVNVPADVGAQHAAPLPRNDGILDVGAHGMRPVPSAYPVPIGRTSVRPYRADGVSSGSNGRMR